jgi:hypothetical protein
MPNLQGIALGRNTDGRLELVATVNPEDLSPGADGAVWRRGERTVGGWSRWARLDMPIITGFGGPAMAANKDGRLEIAATSDELIHAWQTAPNGDQWQHQSLDPPPDMRPLQASPALAQNRDGRVDVFMLAGESLFSGPLWHASQQPQGGWSPWAPLESSKQWSVSERPVVARNRDGRLEVFMGADGAVWHIWQQPDGHWSPWHSLEHPDQASVWRPVVARNRDGRLEVFTQGSDQAVWHIWQQAQGGWSPWHSLEGQQLLSSFELAVAAHADGRLVLFAVADPGVDPQEANRIFLREQSVTGGWSLWTGFNRQAPLAVESPALALDASGQLVLWLRIRDSLDLYRLKQTEPNGRQWADRWDALQPPGPSTYTPQPAGSPPAPPD